MTLSLHDLYGTPYKLLQHKEVKDSYLLLCPPTVKFFESLLATYAIELDDAINPTPFDEDDTLGFIRMLSRTMQMLHVSLVLIDEETTYEDVERMCKEDPTLPARFLVEFSKFLPSSKDKEEINKQKVATKKSIAQRKKKVWIPK